VQYAVVHVGGTLPTVTFAVTPVRSVVVVTVEEVEIDVVTVLVTDVVGTDVVGRDVVGSDVVGSDVVGTVVVAGMLQQQLTPSMGSAHWIGGAGPQSSPSSPSPQQP